MSIMRTLCGIRLRCCETAMDLMQMFGLNAAIDQLTMKNCVHWCSHVLMMESVGVLRWILEFEAKGQRMKGMTKRPQTGR